MIKDKIIIAGGTGFLGSLLTEYFLQEGYNLVILTRRSRTSRKNIKYVQWDGKNIGNWQKELEFSHCYSPPQVWINAGSSAIFGNSGDEYKTEESQPGTGFSPEVCKLWEKAFFDAKTPQTRKVFLRLGLVLQKKEGLLKPFINLAKSGFGGRIGSGDQFISWIHEKDFINIVQLALDNKFVSGIVNGVSPTPVKNKDFMKALRETLKIPFGLPNPSFLVRTGAVFIRTEGDLILQGRRVISNKLKEKGFGFQYPEIRSALKNLI